MLKIIAALPPHRPAQLQIVPSTRATMPMNTATQIRQLGEQDLSRMHGLLDTFAQAFEDHAHYSAHRPGTSYLQRLLNRPDFIALVALSDEQVLGGLVAYELHKFEQERSEIYIYDLAVAQAHRRQGIARALIARLQHIAAERGAGVIFVQADTDEDDQPAIALYSQLGTAEQVLHFDIPVLPLAASSPALKGSLP